METWAPHKPILHPPRVRNTQRPTVEDILKWEARNEELCEKATVVEDDPENEESMAENPPPAAGNSTFTRVEYEGKRYWKRDEPQDQVYWAPYLLKLQERNEDAYVPDKEEPFHFQNENLCTAPQFGDETKMFADSISDYARTDAEEVTAYNSEDYLVHDLYDEFDEQAGDDDDRSVQSAMTTGTITALDRRYSRYYNLGGMPEYETELSVYHSKDEVLDSVAHNRVTIIVGPTGTGKTTQIPLFILDDIMKAGKPCNIFVTQPRRLAATTNATRVASLRKDRRGRQWQIGDLVGYHVGMINRTSKRTCLTFGTTAIFLKIIGSDLRLNRFTHIILDEVHERDQDTDLSLMLVKKMMMENSPHVKLIIMSATMHLEKLKQYFTDSGDAALTPSVVPLSPNYSWPIERIFLDNIVPHKKNRPAFALEEAVLHPYMLQLTVQLMKRLHLSDDNMDGNGASQYVGGFHRNENVGAVLIFLPGMSDIQDLEHQLRKESDIQGYGWDIMALHSSLSAESQNSVMRVPKPGVRRIILSTNIAESSITIPYITFVVDFGLTKRLIVDEYLDVPRLAVQWTSKANMKQREGRCGRLQRGMYYCMVPKDFYEELTDHELPDITVSPIHHSILHVKVLNLPRAWKPHDMFALLLDPPLCKKVDLGIMQLKEAGALSLHMDDKVVADNGEITKIGRILERLPISLNLGRLLIFAYIFGVLEDAMTLAAGLSVRSIFVTSTTSIQALEDWFSKVTLYDTNTESDCLNILSAHDKYTAAIKHGVDEHAFCNSNQLSAIRMRELAYVRKELQMRLAQMGLHLQSVDPDAQEAPPQWRLDTLRVIIAGSFYPGFFLQDPLSSQKAAEELPYGDPQRCVSITHLPELERGMPAGPLYESQLRHLVNPNDMDASIPPEIFYTNDKAYVTFSRHTLSEAGGVSRGVQLAMRARRINNGSLNAIEPSSQYRRSMQEAQQNWRNVGSDLSLFTLSKANSSPKGTPVIPDPASPPYGLDMFDVLILNVVSASRLFLRSAHHSNVNMWMSLTEELQKYKKGSTSQDVRQDLNPGDYAITVRKVDHAAARIQIISRGINNYNVFFVDWGEYAKVDRCEVRVITPALARPAAMALEFNFDHTRIRDVLNDEVILYLKRILSEGSCKLKVYSLLRSVVHGTLFVKHQATDETWMNLNEELKRLGYAFDGAESYLSMKVAQQRSDELMQKPKVYAIAVPTELTYSTNKKKQDTRCKGPFAPIEAKFRSTLRKLQQCRISCSLDSVNQRILDGNPENSERMHRILVASSVERSERAAAVLVIRHSTLLPRQPGLLGILVTLFAPCIQLKIDKSVSREGYVGALSGVGFGKSKDDLRALSLYPDHDMRVAFDAVLSPIDVEWIQNLRAMMNHSLDQLTLTKTDEEKNLKLKLVLQKNVRSLLFSILTRPRKPCLDYEKNVPTAYQWNISDPLWQMHEKHSGNAKVKCTDMFQALYAPRLDNFKNIIISDEARVKLVEMRRVAIGCMVNPMNTLGDGIEYECSQCPICCPVVRFIRRQDIVAHLYTSRHQETEQAFELEEL